MLKPIFPFLFVTGSLLYSQDPGCSPSSPAACYPDECRPSYCYGPAKSIANAPICPQTCNADATITVAGLYWNAHQDGIEHAVVNNVALNSQTPLSEIDNLNLLTDASFLNPTSEWDFGFRLGISYCTPCDAWDVAATWTSFQSNAKSIKNNCDDTQTLMPLFATYQATDPGPLFADKIEAYWDLDINLVDIQVGRNFWSSKYLALRPFMGIRVAKLDQSYNVLNKGGSFSYQASSTRDAQNHEAELKNIFKGVGLMAGLDSTWNIGCGLGLYGNMASSIVYGAFDVDHKEYLTPAAGSSSSKNEIAKITETIKASRAMLDLGFGLQWMGLVCECKYGIRLALGWEMHMFFHQNQMWRISRVGSSSSETGLNLSGKNVYDQSRGSLDTKGWTFSLDVSF